MAGGHTLQTSSCTATASLTGRGRCMAEMGAETCSDGNCNPESRRRDSDSDTAPEDESFLADSRLKHARSKLSKALPMAASSCSSLSHNLEFALAGVKNSEGQNIPCLEVCSAMHVYNKVHRLLAKMEAGAGRESAQEALTLCAQRTMVLLSHLLKCLNQDIASKKLISTMPDDCITVVYDWKMKILPQWFRETSRRWFGKRGFCAWHGFLLYVPRALMNASRAALARHELMWVEADDDPALPVVKLFVHHVADVCLQDAWTTLSSVECFLETVKEWLPGLKSVRLQSDNARYYGSPKHVVGVYAICKRLDLKLDVIARTEAQDGKSLLDAMFGVLN